MAGTQEASPGPENGSNTVKLKQAAVEFLSPASFIKAAIGADPSFRWALLVAGIGGIIATFAQFGVRWSTLVLCVIAVIGLMTLVFVFAQATELAKTRRLERPAEVMIWSFLIMGLVVSLGLVSSLFADWPLHFREYIDQKLVADNPSIAPKNTNPPVEPTAPPTTSNAAISGTPKLVNNVERAVIVAEISDAYIATGRLQELLIQWGQPVTRQTLRVNNWLLTETVPNGNTVSVNVNPQMLPTPRNTADISKLDADQAGKAVQFFSAYDRFKVSLGAMNSNPENFSMTLIETMTNAQEVTKLGHIALCSMDSPPPSIGGGWPEPTPTNCLPSPFFQ